MHEYENHALHQKERCLIISQENVLKILFMNIMNNRKIVKILLVYLQLGEVLVEGSASWGRCHLGDVPVGVP